jgi:hypothetical protein
VGGPIYGPPILINGAGGGGIRNNGGLSVTNSTLANNSAASLMGDAVGGGGILNLSVARVSSSTLSGNTASCPLFGLDECVGAAIYNRLAFFEMKSSILAGSLHGGNCASTGDGPTSLGHNLSDDGTCAFLQPGDLTGVAAGLDPAGLQANGGPTRTIALLPTSPAVNAIDQAACVDEVGDPLTTDQRGVARPWGPACDIGAFEYFASRFPEAAMATFLLMESVQSTPVPPGRKAGLLAPLEAAVDSMSRGNARAASNQLRAFINQTNALVRGKALAPAPAGALADQAQAIIANLGG